MMPKVSLSSRVVRAYTGCRATEQAARSEVDRAANKARSLSIENLGLIVSEDPTQYVCVCIHLRIHISMLLYCSSALIHSFMSFQLLSPRWSAATSLIVAPDCDHGQTIFVFRQVKNVWSNTDGRESTTDYSSTDTKHETSTLRRVGNLKISAVFIGQS